MTPALAGVGGEQWAGQMPPQQKPDTERLDS